tara:strand:+ start:4361 stop:4756 length:396 start_codon:yes stop_codon:yes gene_type:complete
MSYNLNFIIEENEKINNQNNTNDFFNELNLSNNEVLDIKKSDNTNIFNVNIDEKTALEIDYNLNYNMKQLKQIAGYYKINIKKLNKDKLIQTILDFEYDYNNIEITEKRKELWYYLEELKNDKYTKQFILI